MRHRCRDDGAPCIVRSALLRGGELLAPFVVSLREKKGEESGVCRVSTKSTLTTRTLRKGNDPNDQEDEWGAGVPV